MVDPHNCLPIGTLDGLDEFAIEGVDAGISHFVSILRSQGIETCQSCEGGPGHSYDEPTIEFHGGPGDGPRAVGVAFTYGLPIRQLRRFWSIQDGEMTGPYWAMTFSVKADEHLRTVAAHEQAVLTRMGKV